MELVELRLTCNWLPTLTRVDRTLVWGAMQSIPPWNLHYSLDKLFAHTKVSGGQLVEADKKNPSYFVSFIDKSDLREGIVPSRFDLFWEGFFDSKVIAAGRSLQLMRTRGRAGFYCTRCWSVR